MSLTIAFIRGINVGRKNSLPMAELRSICEDLGYKKVKTYIQSGNVLFESDQEGAEIQQALEKALEKRMGRPISVILRSAEALDKIVSNNPFPEANPSRVGVLLFAEPLPEDLLKDHPIPPPEEVRPFDRELIIHYPNGMGRSKLKLPKFAEKGTMRNINTMNKVLKLSRELA